MTSPQNVLQFLQRAASRAERSVLIALTGIEGSAARGIGTLMAVTESGARCGSFSGGCVEDALVGEAQRVLTSGKAELLRIGTGSPLIDIRLPCGSGMDLLFLPDPNASSAITHACQALERRKPMALMLGRDGSVSVSADHDAMAPGWQGDRFTALIKPRLRLFIAGHGEEVPALAALVAAWGAEVVVLSPDERIVRSCEPHGNTVLLKAPGPNAALTLDKWSALIVLFHDHDWETALLAQVLEQDALLIGAMGSRATHARRLETLAAAGIASGAATRIIGPIGLIPAARDPQTLALSVLAQVVEAYSRT